MDVRGIEPRASPMRRERDTTTPHTRRLHVDKQIIYLSQFILQIG